jgi:hypothetical protein
MENKNYTTKSKVEAYLGESITESLDAYILAVQDIIDNYTRRNFKADSEAVERVYNGNGKNELLIDPAIEITAVEVDDSSKDFITYPYNSNPILKVILENDVFTRDYANVSITGKWGWTEDVPDDISQVATELVSKMYQGTIKSDITSEKIGDYSVNYGGEEIDLTNVKSVLDKYKML